MQIDLRTIVIALVVIYLIQVLVFYYQLKMNRSYKGIIWWLYWSIAEAIGFSLLLFQNNTNWQPAVIIFRNLLIGGGTLFFYFGIIRFLNKPLNKKFGLFFIIAFAIGLLFFTTIEKNTGYRSVYISFSILVVSLLAAFNLYKYKLKSIRIAANINVIILLIHSGIILYRSVTLFFSLPPELLFYPNFFNLVLFMDAMLVSLFLTFGLISMIHQRLNADMNEAKIKLENSETRFRLLFENMSEGCALHEIIMTEDGKPENYIIENVNHSFENILNIPAAKAINALSTKLFEVKDPPYIKEYFSVVTNNEPFTFETYFGKMEKHFRISTIPLEQGHFATIFSDITQQKNFEAESKRLLEISERSREILLSILEDQLKVQESLHESNELLSMFIKNSPIYAFIKEVTPTESKVLKASENYIDMIGIPGSEMVGKNMYDLFPPEFAAKITQDDWNVASQNKIYNEEERLNDRIYTTIKFPIRSGDKNLLAGYTIDNTDSKLAEQEIKKLNETLELRIAERTAQLEASNIELEEFTYSVSHDLRAPLRHINGYIDLLNKYYHQLLPEKGIHYIESINNATQQMGALIDDLLQFSRTGRQELVITESDINVLVKEAMDMLNEDIKNRDIEWIIDPLPVILCDNNLMRQVWTNLISNAVKFTRKKEKAKIEIRYTDKKKDHHFLVQDNGAGFDMNYAKKLFGVFQRLHSYDEFEGTGIGLANVRRIIMKHGGRIWAEAQPEQGATFQFLIPKKII